MLGRDPDAPTKARFCGIGDVGAEFGFIGLSPIDRIAPKFPEGEGGSPFDVGTTVSMMYSIAWSISQPDMTNASSRMAGVTSPAKTEWRTSKGVIK